MAYVPKYEEESKKNLVALHSNGKSQAELCREYGVSESALAKWIKNYSKQVKELQKRNAALEEENLILKKAIAIFMPHSEKG